MDELTKKIVDQLKNLQNLRGEIPTFSFLGGITPQNLIVIREILNTSPSVEEIDIVLQSGGGSPSDAYRLIRTFREKYKIVNIIIPFWAKSAATLLALGGTRLVLHEFGELGPIDAQIKDERDDSVEGGYSSALNVQASLNEIEKRSREGVVEMFTKLRAKRSENSEIIKIGRKQLAKILLDYSANFYAPLLEKVDTMEMGVMARYLNIGRMYAQRILRQYTDTDPEKQQELLDFLVNECPDHGYVIDYAVLKNYLAHAIKSDQSPFTPDYSKKLGEISITLMRENPELIGFVNNFLAENTSVKLSSDHEQNTSNTTENTGNKGSGSGSSEDSGKKDL